jgi:2-octaprenyl-6-methoxyphenol hydroxylase
MNVCIIGDGLTSLSLAKNLINKKINVHIYKKNKSKNIAVNRTIGIAKNNLEFFKKEIQSFSKENAWEIKKIEIYSEKLKDNKILQFENNNRNLFYMLKNDELYKLLNDKLLKSKFFKKTIIKKNNFYKKLLKENKYDLIINCESGNYIEKKFFFRKIDKNYYNIAYTAILKHEKIINNIATQVFTKFGPIAFLPISNTETSVVCSLENKNQEFSNKKVLDLIYKHNKKIMIEKISKLNSFKLKSSNLREYYHKNILAFGDQLHKIHPLAGQGFNMTIRDIKVLSKSIQNKIDLGLELDLLVCKEFENKTKHMNVIFSSGVDFIYEFFNFDKKTKNKSLSKILKLFGKNKRLNKTIIKFADSGLKI